MAMELRLFAKWADEKALVGATAASYDDDSDPCVIGDHPAVSIIESEQKNLSTDYVDQTGHLRFLTNQDYMEKITAVNEKLDMVKNIVRPGCSYEVLNTALHYMSLLATTLSTMPQKVRASL